MAVTKFSRPPKTVLQKLLYWVNECFRTSGKKSIIFHKISNFLTISVGHSIKINITKVTPLGLLHEEKMQSFPHCHLKYLVL